MRAALGLLACALAALVHQTAVDVPFVFDDGATVLFNDSLITPWDWRAALLHNPARPVVNLSFALDRALSGFSSFGFHITSIVLHITAVGLFYGWCTRILHQGLQPSGTQILPKGVRPGSDPFSGGSFNLGLYIPAVGRLYGWCTRILRQGLQPGRTQRLPKGVRPGSDPFSGADWAAFFAAAILAVHPVTGVAVAYITARSELLAAAGVFASLIYARRAIVTGSRTAGVVAVIFGALAIGSSSSAAALPLIALAFDAWVLRDPGWSIRAARVYAPATFAVVCVAAWRVIGSAAAAVPARGPIENLLTESRIVWRYLALLIVPRGQSIVHDAPWAGSAFDPVSVVLFAGLAAAVALAIRSRHTHPLVAFGAVWFIGVLAPTSTMIPVRDPMAEHRLYLASAGLLLAAASVSWRAIALRRALRVALAGALFVLAVASYRRLDLWSRPVELWEEAVRRAPGAWQAHWGYAEILREVGRCDRAGPEYDAVLRLYPDHAGARAGLDTCR